MGFMDVWDSWMYRIKMSCTTVTERNGSKYNLTLTATMASANIVNNVLLFNVDNLTPEWRTYAVTFTPEDPGPVVSIF